MASCASCHADLPAGSLFCPRCGVRTNASVAATVGATATAAPMPTPTPTPWHGRFEPGARLGTRYRIVSFLGKGGMGEVYRADDLELNQPVALKFLPPRVHAGAGELDRLRAEVRIARGISHPNVCRTYDISAQDGQVFVVMEYIDGEDLASVLRRLGRPSRDKAIEIARQICLGLAAAHEGGIIHRDLKPANIMIDGRGRVRITDFGLAGVAEELAQGGSGTPAYMAPEQLAGGAASVQSDLYALGLVLYELFTGKRAFDSQDPAVIRRLQADSSPRSPSSLTPDIEPAVDRVILRCLEREPRDRPASAYAVLGALPGGDPLAAALAAGETPSPELVASARVEGSVKPAVVIGCVALVVLAFGWWASAYQGKLRAFTRSETELALRAEGILTKSGISKPPHYTYSGFRRLPGKELTPHFWRRWSPEPLVSPGLHTPTPTLFSPPQALPGSAMVLTDVEGRLLLLEAVPRAGRPSAPDSLAAPADWPALVSAAGYDASRMTRVTTSEHPVMATDSVTAWSVPGAQPSAPPVTLLAGWLGGRIVHVSITDTWGTTLDPFLLRFPYAPNAGVDWIYFVFAVFVPTVGGVFFGVRNLRAGRGDRRGAAAIALFMFACLWVGYLIVQDVGRDGLLRTLLSLLDGIPLGDALVSTITVWFMYVALEPYLRRLWPRVLVSWARLSTGRYRDPIIGRDILAGFALAGVFAIVTLVVRLFVPTEPASPGQEALIALSGTGTAVAMALVSVGQCLLVVMAFFTIVLILQLGVRRSDLAVGLATLLCTVAAFFLLVGSYGPVGATIRAVTWGVCLGYLGPRFGLLASTVGAYVLQVADLIPWTTDISAWYAGRMWLMIALLAALLAYGVANALGGRSILKDPMLEGTQGD